MEASSRNVKAMQLLSSFVRQDSEDLIDIDSPSGASDKRESDQQISRPRNRQSFYERAHTYSPLRWFAKPLWLSPLECARWGWENVDVDVLCCVSCKAHMSGRTPPTQNPKTYDECSRRLTESLRSGHRLACPWSSSPSPEHFLRLPYDTRPKAQQVFKQHVTHLLQLREQLPLLPESQLCDMGLALSQVEEVLRPCSSLPQDVSAHVARSAAVLALTGWTTSSTCSGAAQVHCSLCYRHVGMWNFLTLANPCLGDLPADVSDSEEDVAMNGDEEEVRESEGNISACNGERSEEEVNGDDKTDTKTEPTPAGSESQNGETKDGNVESALTESQSDKIVNTDGTKSDSQSTLKDEADLDLQQPDSAITENKDLLGSSTTTMETSKDQKDLQESGNTAMETDDKSEELLEKGEQDESKSVKTEKQDKQETPTAMETPDEESKSVEDIKSTTTAMETDNKSEEMLEEKTQDESKCMKGEVKDRQETCPIIETGDKKQPGPDSCTKDLIERESDLGVTESVDKIDPNSDLLAKDEKVEKKEESLSVEGNASDVTANHSEPSSEKDQKLNQEDSESTKSPTLSPNKEEDNTDNLGAEKEENPMHDSPCDNSIDKENSDNILNIPSNDNESDKHKLDERDPAVEQDEPPTKRQKTEPVRRKPRRQRSLFQPLSEHHPWCPWVAASPGGGVESRVTHAGSESSGGADRTGWRQVLYLLMPQYSPNKSQSIRARASTASPEVLRSIRRLFNEWTSPGVAR